MKNKPFFMTMVSLLIIFISLIMIFPTYQEYVDLIMYILIALGVVSNPSLGVGYADKIKKGDEM